jgi:hypothetical protein
VGAENGDEAEEDFLLAAGEGHGGRGKVNVER